MRFLGPEHTTRNRDGIRRLKFAVRDPAILPEPLPLAGQDEALCVNDPLMSINICISAASPSPLGSFGRPAWPQTPLIGHEPELLTGSVFSLNGNVRRSNRPNCLCGKDVRINSEIIIPIDLAVEINIADDIFNRISLI
jgi:hypothetical protein